MPPSATGDCGLHREPPPTERPERLSDVPEWTAANVSAIEHKEFNRFCQIKCAPWFSPRQKAADGWAAAIRGSQSPRQCGRALLYEDDLDGIGLGSTIPVIAQLLMIAMRDSRVLIEVPVDPTWRPFDRSAAYTGRSSPHRHNASIVPRWCRRPPFTLGCFFKALTHCPVPPESTHVAPALTPGTTRIADWPASAPVIRLKLSWYVQTWWLFIYRESTAFQAAQRFLLRPRAWVRAIGACVMRSAGLRRAEFITVHIRNSPEKTKELHWTGRSVPPPHAYPLLVEAVSAAMAEIRPRLAPPVFLQTASAESLESFASAIPASRLSFTRNTNRADADGWGGWRTTQKAREVTAHGTVAAVNLWVGSQAAAVISPASSAWTNLLVGLVHGPRAGRALVAEDSTAKGLGALGTVRVCCQCAARKEGREAVFGSTGNLMVALSSMLPAETSREVVKRLLSEVAARAAVATNVPAVHPRVRLVLGRGPSYQGNATCAWARWRPGGN